MSWTFHNVQGVLLKETNQHVTWQHGGAVVSAVTSQEGSGFKSAD